MPVSINNTTLTFNDATTQTTAFTGAGQLRSQIFVSGTTTWTAPAGVTSVYVICIGGGGSASGASGCGGIRPADGGFGGAGIGVYTVVPGTGYAVTVGVGRAGGTPGQPGVTGGTSSFGSLISATGGVGPAYGGATGADGSCTLGTIRNGNMNNGGLPFAPFMRNSPNDRTAVTTATAWTISSLFTAGAGGTDLNDPTGSGSVGGVVYIQWVGGV